MLQSGNVHYGFLNGVVLEKTSIYEQAIAAE